MRARQRHLSRMFASVVASIAGCALLSGCCSSIVRDHARRALVRAEMLKAASVPNPAYGAEDHKAYWGLWDSHVEHLRALADVADGADAVGELRGTVQVVAEARCPGNDECGGACGLPGCRCGNPTSAGSGDRDFGSASPPLQDSESPGRCGDCERYGYERCACCPPECCGPNGDRCCCKHGPHCDCVPPTERSAKVKDL